MLWLCFLHSPKSSSLLKLLHCNLMAAKLLSSHLSPHPSLSSKSLSADLTRRSCFGGATAAPALPRPHRLLLLRVNAEPLLALQDHNSAFLLAESVGYSMASYYTSLGLFVISVPGLWSLIKRSVKSKVVKKTFVGDGESKKAPSQIAGEILSFFTRNNFEVTDRGETITFEGAMVPSRGQAALLTFCTCISLASVALVLTITYPDVGNNWFGLSALSPLAGAYYWVKASRKEEIKVKMMVGEDGKLAEIVVQGDDQQVEQMRKELQLSEKGMVYVKGLFER